MVEFRIFINFKTYPQGTGEKAVELAKILRQTQDEFFPTNEIKIIPIVQTADLRVIKESVDGEVWVQHVDPEPQGKFTGWTSLEAVIEQGASGTLLNHSEHQIPPGTVKQILSRIVSKQGLISSAKPTSNCKLKIEDFKVMVCCKTLGQMERLVKYKPDFIGYEISELIGGEISVTETSPKSIVHGVKLCGEIPLIVGAGINKAEDLLKAKEMGAKGVLISSAVVLAKNQREKLAELVKLVK